ncbi:MAG TPA: 5-oxoprolinase subunit PxpB [Candidatus Limnocylindrales bacterium]|nr:5-oxoprolinase subunit PxpB [Candidatus Limnocylindrales bacterium]
MSDAQPVVRPFGDEAVLVSLGDRIDRAVNLRVHRIAAALAEERAHGLPIGAPVVAYAALVVPFDLARLDAHEAGAAVARVVEAVDEEPRDPTTEPPGRLVEIPTHYGGPDGEDLEEVAERLAVSAETVVELHASTEYEVYMLGFAPGFAYLGIVPEAIAVPRRPTPRPRVPAGSVAIAERQTAVYPAATPGGWNLIGRTDLALWDVERDPPALLATGDRVRFVPVGLPGSR